MYDNIGKLKSYRSFRIGIEESDKMSFKLYTKCLGSSDQVEVEGVSLKDLSVSGLGLFHSTKMPDKSLVSISLKFKNITFSCDVKIIRSKVIYNEYGESEKYFYGVEFSSESRANSQNFLSLYIQNFSKIRLKKLLTELLLNERELNFQSFESNFHLFLSLMQDMKRFSHFDFFIDCIIKETARYIKSSKYNFYKYTNGNSFLSPMFMEQDEKKYILATKNTFIEKHNTDSNSINSSYSPDFIKDDLFLQRYTKNKEEDSLFVLCIPVLDQYGKNIGPILFTRGSEHGKFTHEEEKIATLLATLVSNSFIKEENILQNDLLEEELQSKSHESNHVESENLKSMNKFISKLSKMDENIIISGEAGTGKTYLANLIHKKGKRNLMSLGLIECGEISEQMSLDDILFGSEDIIGRFELYSGGTILFHDIDLLCLNDQKQLYLYLKENTEIKYIALTVKDLEKLIVEGKFYKKLYECFSKDHFHIENLENRKEDIIPLSEVFLKKYSNKYSQMNKELSQTVTDNLLSYNWPNNISELDLAIERLVIYNPGSHLISDINNQVIPIYKSNDTMERYYEKIISKESQVLDCLDEDLRNDLLSVFIIKKYISEYPNDSIEDVSKFYNLEVSRTKELFSIFENYFFEDIDNFVIEKEAS